MSNQGKVWLLMGEDGWQAQCYTCYLIQLDTFHLKLLRSETCLQMPVSLVWLGCTASEPAGCAEGLAGTGTLKQPRRNTSEELPWPTVD